MKICLSKRLKKIAEFVSPCSSVIDVGTDHGYIPAWLAQNKISENIFASDIKSGPLKNAMLTAKNAGVFDKISFLQCAGLDACLPDSVDTIIISGMGGETIQSILEAAPWAKSKRLIIQPQSKINELRRWLNENGYVVTAASLVSDNGKIYVVWFLSEGPAANLNAEDYFIDPCLISSNDPLLGAYTEEQIKKTLSLINGLQKSSLPKEHEIAEFTAALNGFKRIKEALNYGKCQ